MPVCRRKQNELRQIGKVNAQLDGGIRIFLFLRRRRLNESRNIPMGPIT